jgi:hypothetical protein
MSLMGKFREGIHPVLGPNQHASPPAAITTTRPAARYVFFPTEGHATVTAISSNDFNLDAVNEHISFPKRVR